MCDIGIIIKEQVNSKIMSNFLFKRIIFYYIIWFDDPFYVERTFYSMTSFHF